MSKNIVEKLDLSLCYFAKTLSCNIIALPKASKSTLWVTNYKKDFSNEYSVILRKFDGNGSYKLKYWPSAEQSIIVIKLEEFVKKYYSELDSSELTSFQYSTNIENIISIFDYNKDKIFNSEDPAFNYIYLWKDSNQDRICAEEEISSFTQDNVISLQYKNFYICDGNDSCKINNNYHKEDIILVYSDRVETLSAIEFLEYLYV